MKLQAHGEGRAELLAGPASGRQEHLLRGLRAMPRKGRFSSLSAGSPGHGGEGVSGSVDRSSTRGSRDTATGQRTPGARPRAFPEEESQKVPKHGKKNFKSQPK